jgi:glycosyltransferase involved in cell wall biosynthesis
MATPLVSIMCFTYNHVSFIRQCLDGFIMQKTNFPIEAIIHDDASTDGTADIIREYEKKYPDIIKPIYQKENQYSKGLDILTPVSRKFRGKYIALCEGDDYWTDEYKLQKQVDFLEENEDFSICFHPVKVYSEEKKRFIENLTVPEVPDITDIKTLVTKNNYINTPSVMYRTNQQVFKDLLNFPKLVIMDYCLHMLFAKYGKIKKLSDTMAVYRLHKGGILSLKPKEYQAQCWNKTVAGLISYFIDNQEISDILISIYKRGRGYQNEISIYFNKRNNYHEKTNHSFIGNEVDISYTIPIDTISIRLDPIKGCGCVISNFKALSYSGIVEYEPINGYKNNNGSIVFITDDPQIELKGAEQWIKIKYHIMPLTEFSHYNAIYGSLIAERDSLFNSLSWRITKPLRKFANFVRRYKVLRLFINRLLSVKRTIKHNYKNLYENE